MRTLRSQKRDFSIVFPQGGNHEAERIKFPRERVTNIIRCSKGETLPTCSEIWGNTFVMGKVGVSDRWCRDPYLKPFFLPELGYGLPAPVREIQPSQPPDRSCFCNIESLSWLISGVLLAPIIVVTVEVKKKKKKRRFELSKILFTWHTDATKILYKRHSKRNINARFYDTRCWVDPTDNNHKNWVGEQCVKIRVCWYSAWPKFEIFSRYSSSTVSV